jgi:hypothetical protein
MSERTMIKRVCSKCKRALGWTDGFGISGVSHGLCVPCRDVMLREAGLEQYITEDFEGEDMKHFPETCSNPLCPELACVDTRKNREIERLMDSGQDR